VALVVAVVTVVVLLQTVALETKVQVAEQLVMAMLAVMVTSMSLLVVEWQVAVARVRQVPQQPL
jgi:hypothetical protein